MLRAGAKEVHNAMFMANPERRPGWSNSGAGGGFGTNTAPVCLGDDCWFLPTTQLLLTIPG